MSQSIPTRREIRKFSNLPALPASYTYPIAPSSPPIKSQNLLKTKTTTTTTTSLNFNSGNEEQIKNPISIPNQESKESLTVETKSLDPKSTTETNSDAVVEPKPLIERTNSVNPVVVEINSVEIIKALDHDPKEEECPPKLPSINFQKKKKVEIMEELELTKVKLNELEKEINVFKQKEDFYSQKFEKLEKQMEVLSKENNELKSDTLQTPEQLIQRELSQREKIIAKLSQYATTELNQAKMLQTIRTLREKTQDNSSNNNLQ